MAKRANRYESLIEHVFFSKRKPGDRAVEFSREDIAASAKQVGIQLPKNLGDVIYSFRYRAQLPERVRDAAPKSMFWIILGTGPAKYKFLAVKSDRFLPSESLIRTSIPDATPGVVAQYALSDEQALLAKLRYNRLLDIFTGLACYSLQSHLRTTVPSMGQLEVDELLCWAGSIRCSHSSASAGKGWFRQPWPRAGAAGY